MKRMISILMVVVALCTLAGCRSNRKPRTASTSGGYLTEDKAVKTSDPVPEASQAEEEVLTEGAAAEEKPSPEGTMYLLAKERSFDSDDQLQSQIEYAYVLDGDTLVQTYQGNGYVHESRLRLDGKVLSNAVFLDEDLQNPKRLEEFVYDDNGILRGMKRYSSGTLTQDVMYDEEGKIAETRDYRTSEEKLTTIYRDIYDAKNYLLLKVAYDADGSVWTWHEYGHYDESGAMLNGELDAGIAADRVDEAHGGSKTVYTYDSNGWIIHTTESDGKETQYTNDAKGNPLMEKVFYNGELQDEAACTYDANGNVLSREILSSGLHGRYEYTYDTAGNMLSRRVLSEGKQEQKKEYVYEDIVVPQRDESAQVLGENQELQPGNNPVGIELDPSKMHRGEVAIFGTYEQDGDASNVEAIEWVVLDIQDQQLLLISKYCLEVRPYSESYPSDGMLTWEKCTLRGWLNGEFLQTAFSQEEQALIPSVSHSTADNTQMGTKGGNDTIDRVFLLSAEEVVKYFSTDEERCPGATEAIAGHANRNKWWTRTPGRAQAYASLVSPNSVVFASGMDTNGDGAQSMYGVRPAMWVQFGF